ncbi:MAG: hypothetical protein I8H98_11790 [Moraxellaceae bacterium]|nr:hypothetical protein [Moraxellaceae bacterium]MBH2031175.1 hypothetical protein [Moraxellaceae bacterium]
MNYFILAIFFIFSTSLYAQTEVYQCNDKGAVVFQSKPCKGTGKTVAENLKEEKEAKEQKLAEIQAKEKRLQDRLKQQQKKEVGFKAFIINFKNKIVGYWYALKRKVSIDS